MMEDEILLLSAHGHAVFDLQGYLVEDALDTEGFPQADHPKRLDVADFIWRMPDESHAGVWDILEWSYWTEDGQRVEWSAAQEEPL